jgi:hypothetical protein
MNDTTDTLIARLAAAPPPVRRLRQPMLRAVVFLAVAAAVIGAVVAASGLRPNLGAVMAMPGRQLEWYASIATGVLAAIAAFHLAVPGRSAFWGLLPLPAGTVWLASLGYGCWMDFVRLGPAGLAWGTSWSCLRAIMLTSLPLGALLFWMLRFAGPVTSLPVALFGTLGIAALSAAGLTLYHHLEASFLVLLWHIGTILLLTAASVVSRRVIFQVFRP